MASVLLVACQPKEADEGTATPASPAADAGTPAQPTTDEAKIESAMSAAPDSISAAATIMDWPAQEGGEARQLRAGTNGWVCYPTSPSSAAVGASGEDPMCLDAEFQKWAAAWMSKGPVQVSGVGIGYMMRGDKGASISDPYATPVASDWVRAGPHIMVITPAVATLASLPGRPNGGPWVMWQGTPYAHVMVPVP